jgi:hypothetical protein
MHGAKNIKFANRKVVAGTFDVKFVTKGLCCYVCVCVCVTVMNCTRAYYRKHNASVQWKDCRLKA